MEQEFYPYRGNKTTARITCGFPPTPMSKMKSITGAIGYVGEAATRARMAQQALLRDPGCILSHMVISKHAEFVVDRV